MTTDNPYFWLGKLSMALALQVAREGATQGREALEEFIRTRPPNDHLRLMLREELKQK